MCPLPVNLRRCRPPVGVHLRVRRASLQPAGRFRPLPTVGLTVGPDIGPERGFQSIVTGCLRRAKLRASALLNGVKKERACSGHPLTQAQQRIQRAGSVCSSSPFAMAPFGQSRTQRPQRVQRAGSVTGSNGTGFLRWLRRYFRTKRTKRSMESSGVRGVRRRSRATGATLSAASFRLTARPNASAQAASSASGRPAAMGWAAVLYECSPTNAPPGNRDESLFAQCGGEFGQRAADIPVAVNREQHRGRPHAPQGLEPFACERCDAAAVHRHGDHRHGLGRQGLRGRRLAGKVDRPMCAVGKAPGYRFRKDARGARGGEEDGEESVGFHLIGIRTAPRSDRVSA